MVFTQKPNQTDKKLQILHYWGKLSGFCKVMIIRGIGYRVFYIQNDAALLPAELLANNRLDTDAKNNNYYTAYQSYPYSEDPEEGALEWNSFSNEFTYTRYLVVRAGHTSDRYIPLKNGVYIKTLKKDRKLIIFGPNKQEIYDIARKVYDYRTPSAYTGRGIRRKHMKVVRKKGKRDKGR